MDATDSSETVACVRCGAPTDPSSAIYTGDGMVCTGCEVAIETAELEGKAAAQIFGSSGGALGFALLSFVFNPCFFATIASVVGAINAMQLLGRHPEYKAHLGSTKVALVYGLSIAALLVSAVRVALIFVLGAVVAAS